MSITIVSAPSKAPQAASAGSAPGNLTPDATAGDTPGFAGVLRAQFSQRAPQATLTPEQLPADARDVALTDADEDAANAALFAVLGLVTQDSNRISQAASPVDSDAALTGLSMANGISTAPTAQPPRSTAALSTETKPDLTDRFATDDARSAKFETNFAAKPVIEDKSAIIAAASAQKTAVADVTNSRLAAFEATPTNVNASAPTGRDAPLAITTPVRDAAWTSEFADKLVWMATNDKQSAKLTLNPAHMGPLEISLNIDKGHATASFMSANADVREALESALPRLREMFANAGISLGQTNVSAESFQQQANAQTGNGGKAPWSADGAILVADPAASVPLSSIITQHGNGMVDTFA